MKKKLCYEMSKDNPEMSFRDIGKRFGIFHRTVKQYIEDYAKKIQQENNSKDSNKDDLNENGGDNGSGEDRTDEAEDKQ